MIRRAQAADWQIFYQLARAEGWRVPERELQLFKTIWAQSGQVLVEEGSFCGFVTAVVHQTTGWIGNLIIPPNLRGQGFGRRLFEASLAALSARGVESVWLTASEEGRPIYGKSGFVSVDQVQRWVLPVRQGEIAPQKTVKSSVESLLEADCLVWGENRHVFLRQIVAHGVVVTCGAAVALLQQGGDLQMIGPWYSQGRDLGSNQQLFSRLLAEADPALECIVDLFASSGLQKLLSDAGFSCTGQTDLMVYGDSDRIDLNHMVSLASLGSVG